VLAALTTRPAPLAVVRPGRTEPRTAELARLLQAVAAMDYRFITPTPLTHQRVLAHRGLAAGTTLRDVFGWSLPCDPANVATELLALMDDAGVLSASGQLLRSSVRISSINDDLFLHSAYPTVREDAVFFGPDTYCFARFIQQTLRTGAGCCTRLERAASTGRPFRVLDVGCGSGAGAVVAARALSRLGANAALELTMNDINPLALQYAGANAVCAGLPVKLAEGDALSAVKGQFDLIISNPPYLDDTAQRAYRHGGARLGRALSVRIAQEALGRLAPGGQLLLYTGVAIVDGVDDFRAEMLPLLEDADCTWSYSEIDPDVFGEELEQPVYAHVDRIAAVGLVATRRGGAR
jgi:methylase of polypeptide subunit release factors/HAMP domain-containing protein